MEWIQWMWAALALLLLIAEVFVSGFVLMCFAAGAAAASIAAFMGYGIIWQMVAFITVTIVTVLLMRPLAARLTRKGGQNSWGIDRVVGQQAVVLIEIDPRAARGRVRVNREEWQATAADGQPIPAGTVVTVLGVDGTHLRVARKHNW
jgi:membrane protein implicated in regulation of membrane protease activity